MYYFHNLTLSHIFCQTPLPHRPFFPQNFYLARIFFIFAFLSNLVIKISLLLIIYIFGFYQKKCFWVITNNTHTRRKKIIRAVYQRNPCVQAFFESRTLFHISCLRFHFPPPFFLSVRSKRQKDLCVRALCVRACFVRNCCNFFIQEDYLDATQIQCKFSQISDYIYCSQ